MHTATSLYLLLERDDIRLHRSAEPVEACFKVKRPSTGSGLRFSFNLMSSRSQGFDLYAFFTSPNEAVTASFAKIGLPFLRFFQVRKRANQ